MSFGDEERRPDMMQEYVKLGKKPNAYQGLNTANANPKETGSYFARKFEKSYRKFFADEIKEGWAPLYERYVYPRPAITRNGIAFTYQAYDKGSFADGTLHLLVPMETSKKY